MDKFDILQMLSLSLGIAVVLFLFFLIQYFYTGFKKVNTQYSNYEIRYLVQTDEKLDLVLGRIELSIYSIVASITTAYLVTIFM